MGKSFGVWLKTDHTYLSVGKSFKILGVNSRGEKNKTKFFLHRLLFFPYKKYTLWNGNYAVGVTQGAEEPYVKASLADVPEYLFIQIQFQM